MSRATQDTERHTPTYIRGYHPILLTFPGIFCRFLLDLFLSYNPNHAETRLVWAVPRSFATTRGITNCFLFLRVLRCFSSPGLLLSVTCLQHAGLPHSEICTLKTICVSVQLIAAYHVFHRCCEPRHPPIALNYL